MMKSHKTSERNIEILVSIKPKWAMAIMVGQKIVEYRRDMPIKNRLQIGRMWIYATKPVGLVLGIAEVEVWQGLFGFYFTEEHAKKGCLTLEELTKYFEGAKHQFAIRIKKLIPFDKPKTLAEIGVRHAPQSWMYMPSKKEDATENNDDEKAER